MKGEKLACFAPKLHYPGRRRGQQRRGRHRAGAKAARRMTAELCKEVTLLKSWDINLCQAITRVLSEPLGGSVS